MCCCRSTICWPATASPLADSYPTRSRAEPGTGICTACPQTAGGAEHLLFVNMGLLERIGGDPTAPIRTWQDLDRLAEPARRAGLLVLDPTRMAVGTTAHQVWTYANGGQYWDDEVRRIGWAGAGRH